MKIAFFRAIYSSSIVLKGEGVSGPHRTTRGALQGSPEIETVGRDMLLQKGRGDANSHSYQHTSLQKLRQGISIHGVYFT